MARTPGPVQYSAGDAEAYSALAIEGTTYELGFVEVRRMLGDVRGLRLLDFGSGAGRSSRFLKELGGERVYGVDHSDEMISQAQSLEIGGLVFLKGNGVIPLPTDAVDSAISVCAFSEIRDFAEMTAVCQEIGRVVRQGGAFILMTASPYVRGHEFRSFSYAIDDVNAEERVVTCRISTDVGFVDVADTLWEEEEYRRSLEYGGFTVEEISYPTVEQKDDEWCAEATVPPFLVARSVRNV
jgi:SAM-dependent methyltransferase